MDCLGTGEASAFVHTTCAGTKCAHANVACPLWGTKKTAQFRRVRIGVGRPEAKSDGLAEFVLAKFSQEEHTVLDEATTKAIDDLLASLFPSGETANKKLGIS